MEAAPAPSVEARNGIDVDGLASMAAAIGEQPEGARVRIRTRHRWDGAYAVEGRGDELEQAGEITTRAHHAFRTDWPQASGGADSGPAPGEAVLAALAGCVGMSYAIAAARQGIEIDGLEVAVEATVDLRGALGVDAEVRPGLEGIAIEVGVSADADEPALEALGRAAAAFSPVHDTLARPVPIELGVKRLT